MAVVPAKRWRGPAATDARRRPGTGRTPSPPHQRSCAACDRAGTPTSCTLAAILAEAAITADVTDPLPWIPDVQRRPPTPAERHPRADQVQLQHAAAREQDTTKPW